MNCRLFFTAAQRWLGTLVLVALSGGGSAVQAGGTEQVAAKAPFVLAYDEGGSPEGAYSVLLYRRIYGEAFRRMKVPLEITHFPTARLTAMMEHGEIDGEMARSTVYSTLHPSLVRVEESVMLGHFGLYTAKPDLALESVAALRDSDLRVEYRIGVAGCESQMKEVVSASRLSGIVSTRQGLEKLLLDRTDVYCDIDVAVQNNLYSGSIAGAKGLRLLLHVGQPAPLYAYVIPAHRGLAKGLAATLRQMKREGLVDQYTREVLRELGQDAAPKR